jgi:hypothetical protein
LVTIVGGTDGAAAASLCRAFISAGADVWLRLGREANLLAWAETVEVVEVLLAEGVDATTVSYSQRSILFCPAALVFPEACRALVAAGAKPHLTTRVRKRTSAGNQRTADRPPDVRRTSAGRLPDVFRTSAKTRYWVVVVQVPTLPPHWDVVWVAEKHPQKSHNVKPKPPTLQPTRVA